MITSNKVVVVENARRKAAKCVVIGRWDLLRELLSTIEEAVTSASVECRHDLDKSDKSGCTFLHAVCAFRPPLDLVRMIVRLFPEMVSATDRHLRTPLHVAVDRDASKEVTRCLLESDSSCAEAQDREGKTALMLACQSKFDAHNIEEGGVQRIVDMIRFLAKISPRSVSLEDINGQTALEHALIGEAPRSTIRTLQRATINAGMNEVLGRTSAMKPHRNAVVIGGQL